MKDHYVFSAIFDVADDGISIEFPDLPGCYSCADTIEEAYESAEEALALHLYGMEEDGESIPVPSFVLSKLEDNQFAAAIKVNMRLMRAKIENKTIKKTITLPLYMNEWGEQNGINFSGVLQEAIKNMMERNRPDEAQPRAEYTIIVSDKINRFMNHNVSFQLPQEKKVEVNV